MKRTFLVSFALFFGVCGLDLDTTLACSSGGPPPFTKVDKDTTLVFTGTLVEVLYRDNRFDDRDFQKVTVVDGRRVELVFNVHYVWRGNPGKKVRLYAWDGGLCDRFSWSGDLFGQQLLVYSHLIDSELWRYNGEPNGFPEDRKLPAVSFWGTGTLQSVSRNAKEQYLQFFGKGKLP